jgi:membrane protein DedA with SNARE-associated domain
MAVESSIVPLPSEVVIPPAAHLAWSGEGLPFLGGQVKGWPGLIGLVIAGMVGSWVGASVMYWASRLAGRPFVLRYGRFFFVKPEKLEGAERWAEHYGSMGVFMSRLLPAVRHLIGIPAGIVRMNYWKYSLCTVLGAAVWCAVLCYLGVKMGQDEGVMKGELHRISLWLGGITLGIGGLYYFFVHRHMKAHKGGSAGTQRPEPRI